MRKFTINDIKIGNLIYYSPGDDVGIVIKTINKEKFKVLWLQKIPYKISTESYDDLEDFYL